MFNKPTDTLTLANGVKIPCLGYGTWQTPAGGVACEGVKTALKCGYRHIDTANAYGNEEDVGKGIAYNIVLNHEEHDVDVMTGSKDVLLHCLEHVATDREDADAVAPDEIGTVVVFEHLDEARPTLPFLSGVGSAIGRSMGLKFGKTFATDERTQHRRHAEEIIEQNAEHGQKIEHQDPCQRLGRTPVLRQHHHSDVERKNDDHYVQPNR